MTDRPLRVRVAACIVRGDEILLVAHEKAGRRYWLLPGGGVEEGETLVDAVVREVREETGFTVDVGRLAILCEAIHPEFRHILNLVFAAEIVAGELSVGRDGRVCDAAWHPAGSLESLELYPAVATDIIAAWNEEFRGDVRVLGNVWRNAPEN